MDRINETASSPTRTQEALGEAIAEMIDDFGPDFDEEGQPLEEGESDRVKAEQEREKPGRTDEEAEAEDEAETEREEAEQTRRTKAERTRAEEVTGLVQRAHDHGHPEGSQEPDRARSRTSTRSRGRWRWSPRRGCAAPRSGSTHLRPYAQAIRKMTRQVSEAAGRCPRSPLLEEREQVKQVGVLLVTGDRGLAGAFNTQIIRAGRRG